MDEKEQKQEFTTIELQEMQEKWRREGAKRAREDSLDLNYTIRLAVAGLSFLICIACLSAGDIAFPLWKFIAFWVCFAIMVLFMQCRHGEEKSWYHGKKKDWLHRLSIIATIVLVCLCFETVYTMWRDTVYSAGYSAAASYWEDAYNAGAKEGYYCCVEDAPYEFDYDLDNIRVFGFDSWKETEGL